MLKVKHPFSLVQCLFRLVPAGSRTFFVLPLEPPFSMKPVSSVWDHFLAYDEDGNLLTGRNVTKAKTVKCKDCDWERSTNAFRMKLHVSLHEGGMHEDDASPESKKPPSQEESPTTKQLEIKGFLDRKFSSGEQYQAEMAQVFHFF